ncbi:MAG TPA: TlpA disulfide reductase family protein [Chitinophagaceae bacterium]|nr:TlpA disulfide reductase family protein [Chitinophagaceae bacterium]
MMRKYFTIAVILFLVSCSGEKSSTLTVSGTVKNKPAKVIYLEESQVSTLQKLSRDSAAIGVDGKFSFKKKVTQEAIYNLRLDNDEYPFVSIINDAPSITVHADFNNIEEFYTVTGSAASQELKEYLTNSGEKLRQLFYINKKLDSLKTIPSETVSVQKEEEKRNAAIEKLKAYSQKSVQESKSPSLALFILSTYQGMASNPNFSIEPFTIDNLLLLLNGLVIKFPERKEIAGIRNSIESQAAKTGWIGKQAPEISLPDTEGKFISLSSYKGKFVLVDFWASWCGPCRHENPNVVEAYNKYRNKNFTILGVSLDMKKEAWKKAIVDDNLNWAHISDLKHWNSEVVPLYNIKGIPFNVLVDPDGKVIAENLRGNELQQKLGQVLQ